jgi:cysteine desulfurase
VRGDTTQDRVREPAVPARIYFDHHATTPVDPAVLAAMLPYFSERFGNPSSRSHAHGQEAHAAVEQAREQVAALIGAELGEIVFSSGATESDNLALRGGARALADRGRHVVTSAIEHPAVLEPCRTLEREGFEVTRVAAASDGVVPPEAIARALRPDTVLVSLMAANNEVGTLQPVREVGETCRERGIVFHCDAVQALGRMSVDVSSWNVDLMSLSAHKMYGPKGVGALYVRKGRRPRLKLQPQAEGGGQERGLRSGTLNVPGIVGFGEACRLAQQALAGGEPEHVRALRDRLLAGLVSRLGGVTLNGSSEARLAGNLHVSIAGVEAETLILALGGRIALSSGAACAEAEGKGSHVLRAMGLSDERVYTALRFGLGRYNTDAEVDIVVEALAAEANAVRSRASSALR